MLIRSQNRASSSLIGWFSKHCAPLRSAMRERGVSFARRNDLRMGLVSLLKLHQLRFPIEKPCIPWSSSISSAAAAVSSAPVISGEDD